MENEYKQLFVGGDLSGIQKFLYNITSKDAAVSLKGRSFYLSQYMENVCSGVRNLALEANAAEAKVIYCSGGKFYLLTSNTPSVVQAINDVAEKAKQQLWEEHLGQLGISIAYAAYDENADGTINCNGLNNQKPGCLWKIVNEEFAKQKNQKFKAQLVANYQEMFEPIVLGNDSRACAVTGIESSQCRKMKEDDNDEEIYVLPSVYQQIQLGRELRNTEHFKTFEDYAGNTYLGILRMDVDGLGKRFIEGFDSIDSYETFSRSLTRFFEENIYKMQQEQGYREYLNVIYAGGDDLFIVGRWNKVIDFAEYIQKETHKRFEKEGISISGGVAIVNPKFPIAKAAELAGNAEEAAKHFRGGEKNAFHFLGKTVSWKDEFAYVKSYKQQFVSLINGYGLSRSILHKLMLYSAIADHNKILRRDGKDEDFSYVWHISYFLTRYKERYKDNDIVSKFCYELRDKELTYKDGRKLELIALAARWAELELRQEENN